MSSDTAVIGFVGAPWTLAGYMIEGGHSKNCRLFKIMCTDDPGAAHKLLEKLTEAICIYASHQVRLAISCSVSDLYLSLT